MQNKTLLDQIVECLEIESENHAYADVSPAVLQKFMNLKKPEPARSAKPAVQKAPEIIRPVSRPPMPPAPAPAPVASFAKPMVVPKPVSQGISLKPVYRPELDSMQLDELAADAAICTRCVLHKTRNKSVFADGNRKAELMFIGEGPGADEDEQGLPFVGKAGQKLNDMIKGMQFTREEVYIANIVKCRPPENRNPTDEEAYQCVPYLNRQIDIVRPKVIVLLGAIPLKYLLGLTGVTKLHGTWYEYRGIKTMPTLHPAYLLRNESAKRDAWEDLKKVMKVFGKKPAPKVKGKTLSQNRNQEFSLKKLVGKMTGIDKSVFKTVTSRLKMMTFGSAPPRTMTEDCLVMMNVPSLMAWRDSAYEWSAYLLKNLLNLPREKRLGLYGAVLELLDSSIASCDSIILIDDESGKEGLAFMNKYLVMLRDIVKAVHVLVNYENSFIEGHLKKSGTASVSESEMRSITENFVNCELSIYRSITIQMEVCEPYVKKYRESQLRTFSKDSRARYDKSFQEFEKIHKEYGKSVFPSK